MSSVVTLNDVAYSFDAALESLGDVVREVIYNTLERNGIDVRDIPLRIPEVVMILRRTVGGGVGSIVHKMLTEFGRGCSKARTLNKQESDRLAEIREESICTTLTCGIGE